MTEIVADKTVEVVKNAIETADGALDLYNKYLDQVIPWQTFDETIKELSRFKQEYSQAASVLVGDIKTLLMDSAYSTLFDHGLASKSDQRFASIRSTGNLTFSTAF
ncbi:hemolysin E [Escherichia coli]|nr:hemolysin E [Escherichia coli]